MCTVIEQFCDTGNADKEDKQLTSTCWHRSTQELLTSSRNKKNQQQQAEVTEVSSKRQDVRYTLKLITWRHGHNTKRLCFHSRAPIKMRLPQENAATVKTPVLLKNG